MSRRQNQAVFMYYYARSHNGGDMSICSPIRWQLLLNYLVTLDLSLLSDHCNCLLVIKRGCFNNLGESVVQWQDGLPFP